MNVTDTTPLYGTQLLTVFFMLLIALLIVLLVQVSLRIARKHTRHAATVARTQTPHNGLDAYEYMTDYMRVPNKHMYIAIPEHVVQRALQHKQQRRTHK